MCGECIFGIPKDPNLAGICQFCQGHGSVSLDAPCRKIVKKEAGVPNRAGVRGNAIAKPASTPPPKDDRCPF